MDSIAPRAQKARQKPRRRPNWPPAKRPRRPQPGPAEPRPALQPPRLGPSIPGPSCPTQTPTTPRPRSGRTREPGCPAPAPRAGAPGKELGPGAIGTEQRPSWASSWPDSPTQLGRPRRPPPQGQREALRPLPARGAPIRWSHRPPSPPSRGGGILSMVVSSRSRQGSRKLCGTRPPPLRLSGRPAPVGRRTSAPTTNHWWPPNRAAAMAGTSAPGGPTSGLAPGQRQKALGEPQTDRERRGARRRPGGGGIRYLL